MTDLYVVRTEPVPVEEIQPGDLVVLPRGRRVTVERVDRDDDTDTYTVRWYRQAERGEPGFPHPGSELAGGEDVGRYLGSLMAVPAGWCWTVDRA